MFLAVVIWIGACLSRAEARVLFGLPTSSPEPLVDGSVSPSPSPNYLRWQKNKRAAIQKMLLHPSVTRRLRKTSLPLRKLFFLFCTSLHICLSVRTRKTPTGDSGGSGAKIRSILSRKKKSDDTKSDTTPSSKRSLPVTAPAAVVIEALELIAFNARSSCPDNAMWNMYVFVSRVVVSAWLQAAEPVILAGIAHEGRTIACLKRRHELSNRELLVQQENLENSVRQLQDRIKSTVD